MINNFIKTLRKEENKYLFVICNTGLLIMGSAFMIISMIYHNIKLIEVVANVMAILAFTGHSLVSYFLLIDLMEEKINEKKNRH